MKMIVCFIKYFQKGLIFMPEDSKKLDWKEDDRKKCIDACKKLYKILEESKDLFAFDQNPRPLLTAVKS